MLSKAKKGEKYSLEEIEKEYLGGVLLDRDTLDTGFEASLKYYPENSDTVKERS